MKKSLATEEFLEILNAHIINIFRGGDKIEKNRLYQFGYFSCIGIAIFRVYSPTGSSS